MYGENKVQVFILRELIRKRKFGGAHTPLDNITNNLPDELLHNKQGQKVIEKAVKELVNSEFVIVLHKKTGKGSDLHISMNPRKIKEINVFLVHFKNIRILENTVITANQALFLLLLFLSYQILIIPFVFGL